MEQTLVFLSAPDDCSYLPRQRAQLRYEFAPHLTPTDYMTRLREGWRRFGPILFRNECPTCRKCQSLRVPVDTFRPSVSQRRAWSKNRGEVEVRIGIPSSSPQKLDLFQRFHRHGHQTKGWSADPGHDLRLFTNNPFPTEEWSYYIGERLVAVGYVDALPEGLSAIYFFHDPDEGKRSLGTFNVLTMIDAARERGLPHVYLGYYVEGCRSLEYKNRFMPNERLNDAGEWSHLIDGAQ
jgi:arginine-tRNA-protein transferase